MLQITYNDADRILLDMADEAEAAKRYDQTCYGYRGHCGTPACLLGTYARNHPETLAHKYIAVIVSLIGAEPFRLGLLTQLQLSTREFGELFGLGGCGNARNDGKKAAAYVREFVRKRAEARLTV